MAWEPNGGYGDGALVAGDLLAAARERGVRYRPRTPVQALLREGDRVTGIQTQDGPEHAGVVVAAAGVWSPALLASALEFLLEGLHLTKRLNKDASGARALYRGRK